jgi:hypothetical protein
VTPHASPRLPALPTQRWPDAVAEYGPFGPFGPIHPGTPVPWINVFDQGDKVTGGKWLKDKVAHGVENRSVNIGSRHTTVAATSSTRGSPWRSACPGRQAARRPTMALARFRQGRGSHLCR